MYRKTGVVYARAATEPGTVVTNEGSSDYRAGDYLVFNEPDDGDAYAVSKDKFEKMYQPLDGD